MNSSLATVVIGTGMAGFTLVRELRKIDPDRTIVMLTEDNGSSYPKPTLSNALTLGKTPASIPLADATKMATQLNCTIISHVTVTAIDPQNHCIHYTDAAQTSTTLAYQSLVIANGAEAIVPALQNPQNITIHTANQLADYASFSSTLAGSDSRKILLMGAGLIGCEFANDLSNAGHQVTVIDISTTVLGRLLPSEVALAYQTALAKNNIQFELDTSVSSLAQSDQGIVATLANGTTLTVDCVLSAVGLRPKTTLAHQAGIECNRGIITDLLLQTSIDNIYALGDCAEINGLILPYIMPIMAQAKALAKTLTGTPTYLHYPAMPVSVKTPAAPLVVAPLMPNSPSVQWHIEPCEDGLIATAIDIEQNMQAFALLGATAAKQRLSLTKALPDWLGESV